MADVNLLTQLYNDFMTVLDQTVIKYNVLAEKAETVDSKRESDAYLTAYLMKDKFNTYVKYDEEVIADIMDLDMTYQYKEVEKYRDDNSLIPFKLRDTFLEKQRAKILNEYEEKNNYYRMLNGLPDYGELEEEFIFVPGDVAEKYNIDIETPLHLLDETKISLLQTLGIMDKIIAANPTKKYLQYLGNKKIDIVTARTAKNFAVLRIPYDVSDTMWDQFALIYEQCREYFMTCIYVTEMRDTIQYYDNFMAMCVMVMAMVQVIARVIKDTIERNFFDDYCVRTLFSVYGVPYYTYMDSGIKRQIVQDLNILVMNKGTNKVLYDIASILGYDRLKIYKYYLMKVQKFDVDGIPVVYYKDEPDPITGEPVLDYERMYDVYFQKVELKDLDTYKSLLDPSNRRSYDEITSGDPFWHEDDDLFREVYESEYNFVETKYLGVSIAYRLSKILFENVYLMKMILEKKDELPGVTLSLPKISPFTEVTLFDAIVALCAMTCKQNHLKGEILTRLSAIMHIMGFNFSEDFEKIKQDILDNPYLDNDLTKFFKDSSTYTVEGINRLYNNIVDLYDVIVERLSTCQDIEVYDAYWKFYQSLYYTDENCSMFAIGTNEDGTTKYAVTFLEYLEYANPDLFTLINETEPDKFTEYINHICQKVIAIIPTLKYFGIMAGRSETMEKMLVDMICFFKSYTTDMLGLNVLYIFDMKPELLLRLIDDAIIHKNIQPEDDLLLSHADHLRFTSTVRYRDRFRIWDRIHRIFAFIYLFDELHFWDKIHHIHVNLEVDDGSGAMKLYDFINDMLTQMWVKDRIHFRDTNLLYSELGLDEHLHFWEYLQYIYKELFMSENFTMFDNVDLIRMQEVIKDTTTLRDLSKIYATLHLGEHLTFTEFLGIVMHDAVRDNFTLYDITDVLSLLTLFDTNMKVTDKMRWTNTDYLKEALEFTQKASHIQKASLMQDHAAQMFDLMHTITKLPLQESLGFRDCCIIIRSENSDSESSETNK